MAHNYNRSGARRAGDDYQDLIAAELLVEWLENPSRYRWVQIEAESSGALDDVVAARTDGSYVYRQVKFTVDPEEHLVDWDYLTKQKKGKLGPLDSLLQRWATSFSEISSQGPVHEASLVTNRSLAPSLAHALDRSDPPRKCVVLAEVEEEVREKILVQLSDEQARQFFQTFSFKTDEPAPEAMEEGVKRRFFRLGGTERGWAALLSSVREWAKFKDAPKPDGFVTLAKLRGAVLWNSLQRLPQDFPVPPDYVCPLPELRDMVFDTAARGGIPLVVYGEPGVGKSTFLSYLVPYLQENEVCCVRHHYYLANSRGERCRKRSVAESLAADLLEIMRSHLGETSRNPSSFDLDEYLKKCGEYFQKADSSLVVILDGLDHVERDLSSLGEVEDLLRMVLPLPDGVTLIVGTQWSSEIERALNKFGSDDWKRVQLPRLTLPAVDEWLSHHASSLGLDLGSEEHGGKRAYLSKAFFDVSGGLPLHLHYSLASLLSEGGRVTASRIRGMETAPSRGICSYYTRIWNSLTTNARLLLAFLSATPFSWTETDLNGIFCEDFKSAGDFYSGFQEIRHLLSSNSTGLGIFHGSLRDFVKGQQDYHNIKSFCLKQASRWLATQGHSLRKSTIYRWWLEKELGNVRPIIDEPNFDWAEESLAEGQRAEEICETLQLSAREAIREENLPRWAYVSHLESYVRGHCRYYSELYSSLTTVRLAQGDDELRERILDTPSLFSVGQVAAAALDAFCRKKDAETVCEAFQHLDHRHRLKEKYAEEITAPSDWNESTQVNLLIAAGRLDLAKYLAYIRERAKRASAGDGLDRLDTFCRAIVMWRRYDLMFELVEADLNGPESVTVTPHLTRILLLEKVQEPSRFANRFIRRTSTFRYLLQAEGESSEREPVLEQLNVGEALLLGPQVGLLMEMKEYFYWALRKAAAGEKPPILHDVVEEPWLARFLKKLREKAISLGQGSPGGEAGLSFLTLFEHFGHFFFPARELRRHQLVSIARRVLYEIGLDFWLVTNGEPLTVEDLDRTASIWSPHLILSYWNDYRLLRFDDSAARKIERDAILKAPRDAEGQQQWADELVPVAEFSASRGDSKLTEALSVDLARKLLGHGHRKDRVLFDALDLIELGYQYSLKGHRSWFQRLKPMFFNILEFTDGKGTRHLPARLARFYAAHEPETFEEYREFLEGEWPGISCSVIREFEDALEEENSDEPTSMLDENLGSSDILKAEKASDLGIQAADYPAPKLPDYLDEARERVGKEQYWNAEDESVEEWVSHWEELDPRGTFQCLERFLESSTYPGHGGLRERLFELKLRLDGKNAAWPFLVRAHILGWGWCEGFTKREHQEYRWGKVRELYPERWMEFIHETLRSDSDVPYSAIEGYAAGCSMARYLVLLGKLNEATGVIEAIVSATWERGRGLNLRGTSIEPLSPELRSLMP